MHKLREMNEDEVIALVGGAVVLGGVWYLTTKKVENTVESDSDRKFEEEIARQKAELAEAQRQKDIAEGRLREEEEENARLEAALKNAEDRAADESWTPGSPEELLHGLIVISPECMQWGLAMGIMWYTDPYSLEFSTVKADAERAARQWSFPPAWIAAIGSTVRPDVTEIQNYMTRFIFGSQFISPYYAREYHFKTMVSADNEFYGQTAFDDYYERLYTALWDINVKLPAVLEMTDIIQKEFDRFAIIDPGKHKYYEFTIADRLFGLVNDLGRFVKTIWDNMPAADRKDWPTNKNKRSVHFKACRETFDSYFEKAQASKIETVAPPNSEYNSLKSPGSYTTRINNWPLDA